MNANRKCFKIQLEIPIPKKFYFKKSSAKYFAFTMRFTIDSLDIGTLWMKYFAC